MNLIEQFGYEAVKSELKNKKWRKDNLHGSAEFTWHMEQHIQLLEAILLQYRRQHNIFEESDKIVFIDDFMHGELMTVAWTRKGEVWMDDGAKRCTDLSMIRHATDAGN